MSIRETNRRGLLVKAAVGLAITTGLVLFLLRYIDPRQVGQLLTSMDWLYCLTAFGIWLAMYLVRALRFVLLAPKTPFLTMLCIASVHNFLLRVLPMRTGEISYGLLVRRAGTAGLGESLLGLLLLRVLDATVVVVVFSVTLSVHRGIYLGDRRLGITVAAAAALLGIVVVMNLGRLLRAALGIARGGVRLLRLEGRETVKRSLARVEGSVKTFSEVGPRTTLAVAAVTVVLWLLTFSAFFAIMRGFSMPVGIPQTVLGSTAAVVTGFLPIGGIGSFGTMEAGWALGFVLVGLDREKAVASGFGVSLTSFVFAAILGLAGWIWLGVIGRRKSTREHV